MTTNVCWSSSRAKSSSCSTPWITAVAHHVTWSWIGVACPGRATNATTESVPSGSACSSWLLERIGFAEALLLGEQVGRLRQVVVQVTRDPLRDLRPTGRAGG